MDWRHLLFLAGLFILTSGQTPNYPPKWVTSSYSKLAEGISESTLVNSILGQLNCTDPDGDQVIYGVQSGKAVNVSPNGVMTLALPLDYEQGDPLGISLTFYCVDVNGTVRLHDPVTAAVVLSIDDANDNPPVFQVADAINGYSFSILENATVGTIVTSSIQTIDKDKTNNAALKTMYLICNSQNATEIASLPQTSKEMCVFFDLTYKQLAEGKYNGTIFVKDSLDYEKRPVFTSKIVAIDGPGLSVSLSSTVNLQILIIDVQDMPPFFTNLGDTTTISENTTVGTTVMDFRISARDGDVGDKRPINISILSDPLNVFNLTYAVETTPGEGIYSSQLIIKNKLDRETNLGAYMFVVQATEMLKNTTVLTLDTATATYSIYVSDVNDNAPTCSQNVYGVNVTEVDSNFNKNTTLQITGLQMFCYDLDEGINAKYNITIIQETAGTGANAINIAGAYSISPNVAFFTGNATLFLRVDNPVYLDYDKPQYRIQTIVFVARETDTAEKYSTSVTISLYLQDINDNAPKFDQQSYQINISEASPFPKDLINITAHDVDSGVNGQVVYRLASGDYSKFSINNDTGVLTLIGQLNYEETSVYIFLVVATDRAAEPRSSQVQVTVNVENYNDVPPKFRQTQYQTSVSESSLIFQNPITVSATDDEVGTVSITYRIVSVQPNSAAFVLNATTGELTLRSYLDFANSSKNPDGSNSGRYTLVIEASDNGQPPLFATTTVTVIVIDENNHAPVVNPLIYNATLNETAKEGTSVVQILATDEDANDNGKLSYILGEGSTDNFAVNETTGLVTVGPAKFDYDVQKQYTLLIIVADGGAPQKIASATVYVSIRDNNNKDPSFAQFQYLIYTDDRDPTGTIVDTVSATDPDLTHSLVYSILTNTIIATGPNGVQLSSNSNYNFRDAFGVNNNGGIYIKNKLDHNIAPEITFALMVRDTYTEEGVGTATTQIAIMIRGAVDDNIYFDTVGQVFMSEDALVDYSPLTVTARDANNQPIQDYEKLSGSPYFNVENTTGKIYLVKQIDYETDTMPNHVHTLVIAAYSTNHTQSATITCTISIVDVNDNQPKFVQSSYTAQVSENAVYPTRVVTISATDADSRSFGPLGFSITGLDSADFTIFLEAIPDGTLTRRQGQVIVASGVTLNYNRRSQYDLSLIVEDNMDMLFSSVRLSNVVPLTIYVIDENNYTPVFSVARQTSTVPETAEITYSIVTLVATDLDQGLNGEIVYSLEAANEPNSIQGLSLFTIGSQTGIVRVAQSLLGQGNKVFHLIVRARDKGSVPNSSTMDLFITVLSTEDNDGNPQWLYPPIGFNVTFPENEVGPITVGGRNGSFFIVNARTGPNITYEISPFSDSPDSFYLNSSGVINVVKKLDRERKAIYSLIIIAEDTNNTLLYRSLRQIFVILTDENDNNATFDNPKNYTACRAYDRPYVVYVKENTAANVSVIFLKACDPDTPPYAGITYQLYNDNAECAKDNNASGLWVDQNGQLLTSKVIDYEQDQEFIMCVQALSIIPADFSDVDSGVSRGKRDVNMTLFKPFVDSVVYLDIKVLDVNDNGPKFPFPSAYGIVQTNPGSNPVLILDAQDVDGSGNNIILYRIENSVFYPQGGAPPSPFSGAFSLRGDKGVLYATLPSYQAYSGGRFVLTIVATDSLNSSLTDSQEITIYVYEKGQAVKAILNLRPDIGSTYAQTIISQLDNVPDKYKFVFLRVSEHITQTSTDASRTDVCFLAIDSNTNNILNIRELIVLLSGSRYQDILTKQQYHVINEGQCYPSQSSESSIKWRNLWWVLVAVAIFVFVCCLILIILVIILYDRYKRFMETKKIYLVSQ